MQKQEWKTNLRALVAGGAGFVGSHLCRRLLQSGYGEVICVDNLQTGRIANVADLLCSPHFRFFEHDIVNGLPISGALHEIYHLACPASPVQYQKSPIHTFKTSVLGSIHLLELAKEKGARILFTSTSEVYGDAQVSPQNESYWGNVNPFGIRSCYDEGKRGAETLFHDYHEEYGVDTRIIRIFNTYGPQMSAEDGRVVSNFIVQALRGEPLTIHGDGTQTRSFQYVTDLIEAIVRTMRDGVPHGPINVGNPYEISVNDLAERVLRMIGSRSPVVYKPLPQDDPCRRRPDITLAASVLDGWKPVVGLDEGLSQTIAYFRQNMNQVV